MPREGACEEMKALILRRPPTEVGLARLRQPKVSKSATADFDRRPSRRMATGTAEPRAILRDAPLRSGAPQTVCPFPCGGDSPSMRLRGLPGIGRAEPQARRVSHERA